MPAASRVVQIRDYVREQLTVTTTFAKDTYYPGERVTGLLTVQSSDGSPFTDDLTYTY